MADWSSHNITLTAKGASALSKVQAGSGSLTITRVIASEQYVAESTLREVTSLSVENLPLTIIDRHEVQDGGSVIQVQLSNLYLGNAFTLNEIGVFATHSDNPSEEFLYIIAQVDADTGDKIPVYATTPVTATYDIYLYNVGADNIEITISSAGLVTYEALNKACDIIQRNTAYEVGDILHSPSLKKGLAIKCTVAGITKSTDTDLSHKNVGDTVEDGGVTWTVVKYALTTDVPPLASALATPRKIELTGKAEGSTSFDGSANASINVTSVNADAASKLATPRKIELTGNVTGSANFDGSKDIQIATSLANVSALAHSLLSKTTAADMRGVIEANAQTCGGIVAQSLTNPGYVKFANSLLIEWGTVYIDHAPGADGIDTTYHKWWSFPIKMSVSISALATGASGNFYNPQPFCVWPDGNIDGRWVNCPVGDRRAFVLAIGIA